MEGEACFFCFFFFSWLWWVGTDGPQRVRGLQMTWQQLAGAEVQSRPSLEPLPRCMLTEMVFSHRGS